MKEFEPLLKEDKDELTFENKEEVQNEPIIKEEKVIQENDTQDDFNFEKLLEQVVEEQPLAKNETTKEEPTPEIKVTTEEVKEEPTVVEERVVVVEDQNEPVVESSTVVSEEPKKEEIKEETTPVVEQPKETSVDQQTSAEEPKTVDSAATETVTPPETTNTPASQTEEVKDPEVKTEEPKEEVPQAVEQPTEAPVEQPIPTEEPKVPEVSAIVPAPSTDNNQEGQNESEPPKEKNKELPPNKKKTALIVTIILAVLALYLLGRTAYGFYIGFKYYDYDSTENKENKNNDSEINNVEEVSLDSLTLQNTFNKFKVGICSSNYTMIDNLYTTEKVSLNKFSIDEIGTILFSNVSNIPSCGSGKVSVSKTTVSSLMLELFGTEAYMGELSTFPTHVYGNLSVDYDSANSAFNVGYANCELCANTSDFIIANIERATSDKDYLYVYERFGYFKNTGDNTFNVFSDGLLTNPKTTFVKTDANSSFSDLNTLTLYKWTFRKTENNNYHFVSIEPTN